MHKELLTDCEVCGASFKTVEKMRDHLGIHSDPGRFQCLKCAKRGRRKQYWAQRAGMRTHMVDYHHYKSLRACQEKWRELGRDDYTLETEQEFLAKKKKTKKASKNRNDEVIRKYTTPKS